MTLDDGNSRALRYCSWGNTWMMIEQNGAAIKYILKIITKNVFLI